MCDALTFSSAIGDVGAGIAGSIDARSAGDFEAAQLDAMKTLASARGSDREAGLRREFALQAEANLAAAAVSGLAGNSFDAITSGNEKDLADNAARISREVGLEHVQLNLQKSQVLMDAKLRASAALYGGFSKAAGTLYDGERIYQETNTGQTRTQSFMRSIRPVKKAASGE